MDFRERWAEIEPLLDQAMELPPASRAAFLAAACGTDRELLNSVERLLAAAERADEFFGLSAPAFLAPLLTHMTAPDLGPGHRLGSYEVRRQVGRGGMATVYLARDLKHDRDVALKVLRPDLSARVGAERFLREIRISAQLDHPHILTLIDSGESDGLLWYVLPHIHGESLRDRIIREKQLGLSESLVVAKQIAGALEYAHHHRVVHRDIKPENILLHEGEAILADFGIALAISDDTEDRLTGVGTLLGTPQYMSPEQAIGDRVPDARSDIYSLAAVLYEMLTGEPPHTGATPQNVVAKLLAETPARARTLRGTIPVGIDNALARALSKSPADRFASAADFSAALENPALAGEVKTRSTRDLLHFAREWSLLRVAAAAVAAVAAPAFLWVLLRPHPKPVSRYILALPKAEALLPTAYGPRIALSPDGSRLVYVGPSPAGTQLWFRQHDQLHATPIPGTEGAESPSFSPDGQYVGFLSTYPYRLKVASLRERRTVTLADSGLDGGGIAWGSDGYIYFDTPTGIERIKADGGARDKVATPDTAHHEAGFAWPEVLPHGKGLLLRMRPDNGDAEQYRIVVVDLRTRERHELVQGVFARYATPGYLVFATADGRLFVVPFDQDKLAVRGLPTEVLDGLGVHVAGGVDLSISAPGTLAYTTRSVAGSRRLVWVSRDGASLPVDTDLGDVLTGPGLSLSPDGRSLAVGRFDDTTGRADIWVKRLDHGPFSRLTFEGRLNGRPVWAPDGRSILFISYGVGTYSGALYARSEDGGGSRKMLASADRSLAEGLVSSDGRWIIVRTGEPEPGGGDILVMHAGVDSAPRPLLATKFTEAAPTLSPDEHWLAYTSNESGRREVYVRPFPEVNTARWQISSAGGTEPRWAHSGRELFYRNGAGDMVAAQVTTRSAFSLGQQRTLFSARTFVTDGSHRAYDVSPDDQRFIMIASDAGDDSGELILVQNWFEELKAKVKNAGH